MNPPSRSHLLLCIAALALTACSPSPPDDASPILVFRGRGTSQDSARAIGSILEDRHLKYATLDSRQLNAMSATQLMIHRLLIVPGGNYITMGDNLKPDTCANVHHAVQGGMNYLGICAGGLLAGNPPSNSFDLTSGVHFGFYSVVNQGIHKTTATIANADGTALQHYWEDGPQFTGWGEVVGRYPDRTPAIVEGTSGKGWVVLCGVHPEAPDKWRWGMNFTTPTSTAHAYAGTLIDAAFRGTPLPHY